MQNSIYEKHNHQDPDMPFLFFEGLSKQRETNKYLHWHEDIEILKFTEDSGIVYCNGQCIKPRTGDIVIISPNTLHTVCTTDEQVSYYCLLIGKSFYEQKKLPLVSASFQMLVNNDAEIDRLLNELLNEFYKQKLYYKQQMQSHVITLLIHICRCYRKEQSVLSEQSSRQKEIIVKNVIQYLQHHYTETVSMQELADEMGFSYYYLCHVFKELTMLTIVEYIQQLRCNYAMQLLSSTKQPISEIAEQVGFNNVSYFSKIYKRCMGRLPSDDALRNKPKP